MYPQHCAACLKSGALKGLCYTKCSYWFIVHMGVGKEELSLAGFLTAEYGMNTHHAYSTCGLLNVGSVMSIGIIYKSWTS